jgi:hypothetical protein
LAFFKNQLPPFGVVAENFHERPEHHHTEVAVAVDPRRRHQGGDPIELLEWGQEQPDFGGS